MPILPLLLLLLAPDSRDPYLDAGIRQVTEGDFEAAVFSLDTAANHLASQSSKKADLAQTYLWLGAAHVGLDHLAVAKGKFRQALAIAPKIRASLEDFPGKVIKAFEEVRLEGTARKKHKQAILALGGGSIAAVGAVGLAAIKGGHAPDNRSPAVAIQFQPGGDLIVGVTEATFTASAADPDGDSVTYTWTLGDGTSATTETVRHVYQAEGTHQVTLAVRDGKGATTTSTLSVTVRSLKGTWYHEGYRQELRYECTQSGNSFECWTPATDLRSASDIHGTYYRAWRGTLTNPRAVNATIRSEDWDRLYFDFGEGTCSGELSVDLNTIACLWVCDYHSFNITCTSAGAHLFRRVR
jgi:hypothetical protein